MNRTIPIKARMIAAVAALALLGAAAAIVMPWIRTLYDPAVRDSFTAFVDSLGIWGYLLMFTIQVLQVIVAIIPGEPVELVAGVLYGGLGGLLMCMAGCVAGSAVIFIFMRTIGGPIIDRIFKKKKLQEFSFMQDSRKLETVTLLLFMLPGTPKDMLTYIAGTTGIPMLRFIVISTFARIPSIVTSTFIGDSVLAGNWYTALILLIITFALGLAGIFFRERVMDFCRRHSPRRAR